MRRKAILLVLAMITALVLASGVAWAVNKVCLPGTTQFIPCSGTIDNDTLLGTPGPDYIVAKAGNDHVSGGAGDDVTNGGGGNDTYSYKDGWGEDTLIDASGIDHLNFSAAGRFGGHVDAFLVPGLSGCCTVTGPAGTNGEPARLDLVLGSTTAIEKVTGSTGHDFIQTGKETNTLRPGPGTGGAQLNDFGGLSLTPSFTIPESNDTYTGFAASGYGPVLIKDWAGTADKLVLPFASTDVYLEASTNDGDDVLEDLLIMSSGTDLVLIYSQLQPNPGPNGLHKGHIEQIVFTDGTLSIGTDAQAAALNAVSTLEATEKEKRSKVAKKVLTEAKEKAQDNNAQPSPSGGGER